MNHAFLLLASYIVNAAWQIPLFALVAWGVSKWVKSTGPELPHKVSVTVLILAILAPAAPIFRALFPISPIATGVNAPPPAILGLPEQQHVAAAAFRIVLAPALIYVVCGLYLSALLFFSLRLWWGILRTSALVCDAQPAPMDPNQRAMWNRSKQRFGVPSAALLSSPDVPGPVTLGYRQPVLLIPAGFLSEHSQTELLASMGHECAHIRRNDFRKNLCYELLALPIAFHPVTWFLKSQIAQTREMICDGMAAEELLDRRVYGQSLLRLAAKMPSVPAATHAMGMFDAGILERRIRAMMTSATRLSPIRQGLRKVTAILLLSLCAAVSASFTQPVTAQTANRSTKPDAASTRQASGPDLVCSYYDKGVDHPGTCGVDPQDKTRYRCYSDVDPSKSNLQSACKSKVLRALGTKK